MSPFSGCTQRLACAQAMRVRGGAAWEARAACAARAGGATSRHACVEARRGSARRSTSAAARPGRGAASSISNTFQET